MSYAITKHTLDRLHNKLNNIENINRAKDYLSSIRKVSIDKFKSIPFFSGDLSSYVNANNEIYSEDWLSNSIFFPIHSIEKDLIGFDVRYLGSLEDKLRYYKIKVNNASLFNYNVSSLLDTNKFIFVFEGVIDLESINSIIDKTLFNDVSLISPLTCLSNFKYFELLLYCKSNIVICYDCDEAGLKSKNKIKTFCKENNIHNIFYLEFLGKDVNDSLCRYGQQHLIDKLNILYKSINLKSKLQIYG